MKRLSLILGIILLLFVNTGLYADAAVKTQRNYKREQQKEYKTELKEIKKLFVIHNEYANQHNIDSLSLLYSDDYVNNDGFKKDVYMKSIKDAWKECKDLSYTTSIKAAYINGENASIQVEESALGTVTDKVDSMMIAGEIHSYSNSIYHLIKRNGNWYISGETVLSDESSLLYGDARFMDINLQSPNQVGAGEQYTVTVEVNADDKTFIVGSIDHDLVTYPQNQPESKLRTLPPNTQILERIMTANKDNINEYAITSLAISKTKNLDNDNFKIYMAGLACIMRRVNVVPKNNFAKIEEEI